MIDQGPAGEGLRHRDPGGGAPAREVGRLETVARVMYRTTGNREEPGGFGGYFHDRFEKVWAGLVLAVKADNASWQTEGPPLKQAFRPCTCTARAQATAAGIL